MTGPLLAKAKRVLRANAAFRFIAARASLCRRNKTGIAAVEFALLLPMMLALYFGVVVLAQGLEVGRKTQLLSHTLSDLTAQTLAQTGQPTLADTDINNIFSTATAVLYPFSSSNITSMTISEVVFVNSNTNGACCIAKLLWSVGAGTTPSLRACGTFTQSLNGVNGGTNMPVGVYPTAVASGNTVGYYLIVADVTYAYRPGLYWQSPWTSASADPGYQITQTTYMTPRAGSTTPINWTPGGAATPYNKCTVSPIP